MNLNSAYLRETGDRKEIMIEFQPGHFINYTSFQRLGFKISHLDEQMLINRFGLHQEAAKLPPKHYSLLD